MVAHRCDKVRGGRRIQNSEFRIQNDGEGEERSFWGGQNGAIWNHFGALLEVF